METHNTLVISSTIFVSESSW